MADERYLVLARKWRPQAFETVVGQEHITRTLQNAITSGRIGHAYLFIGSRGIGKTTTARILAKALNCESVDAPTPDPCGKCSNCTTIAAGNNIDVMEIDGASNNGVDDVRQIRENIRLVPARSRYRIYIIDEVHQLSLGAFNALLKTLEEPPEHAIFILATTEARKVPATIVSRCQRYDFRRVGLPQICELLRKILVTEKVECGEEALQAIARAAEGGIRDAESILEQLISYCGKKITFKDVFDVLGLVDWQVMHDLCDAFVAKDVGKQLKIIDDIVAAGKDLGQFVQELLRYFRNLLVCKTADAKALLALPDDDIALMQKRAEKFTLTDIIRIVEQFAELTKDFDSQLAQRIALESLLIRMSKVSVEVSVDSVLEKLMHLGEGGGDTPRPLRVAPPAAAPKAGNGTAAERTPEPVATPPAPTAEKIPTRRAVVNEQNMGATWSRAAFVVNERSLSLGVWLGSARPVAIDGDILVLGVERTKTQARAALEKAENVAIVEDALTKLTSNLKHIRYEAQDPEGNVVTSAGNLLPVAGRVNVEQAKAVLHDPHIAKVVDVFKGKIVEIRHVTREQEDEEV
jgi:DNA polymerase-3 subunit gamma/tau